MTAALPRRRVLAAGVAGAGLAALGGLVATPLRAAPAALGDAVRWPTVTLLDGQSVDAQQLQGVATLVVFFSTTCPYCQRHNQHIEKLLRSTRGQSLRVIAAALDKSAAPVQAYLARHRYSFPVTLDERPLHEVLTLRKVIPLTCVIDRAGRLREVIPGEMYEDDVLGLAKWAQV